MYRLEMLGYVVRDIKLHNDADGAQFQLKHSFEHQVRYTQDQRCNAELTVETFRDDDASKFSLRLVIDGIFRWEGEQDKARLHADTFRELYPFAKAAIANLTVNAGLPPVIIPAVNIEGQAIYRIEK